MADQLEVLCNGWHQYIMMSFCEGQWVCVTQQLILVIECCITWAGFSVETSEPESEITLTVAITKRWLHHASHFPVFELLHSFFSLCHLLLSFNLIPPPSITGRRVHVRDCPLKNSPLLLDMTLPWSGKCIPPECLTRLSRDIKCKVWSLDQHTETWIHRYGGCMRAHNETYQSWGSLQPSALWSYVSH